MTHKRAYALTPVKQPIVAGANGLRVHLYTPNLFKFCRGPRAGLEKGTHTLAHVTCPDCLKLLNLAHPKQPPCGSTTGIATLSAESAQYPGAKKPIIMQAPLVVPPRRIRLARGFC